MLKSWVAIRNVVVGLCLVMLLVSCGEPTPESVVETAPEIQQTEIHYEDLAAFEGTLGAIAAGAEPEKAYADYMAAASAGFQGWTKRYNVSPERFVTRVAQHREVFQQLPGLEDDLRSVEPLVQEGLHNLRTLAGSDEPLPVYYFVSSQHELAGTPVLLDESTGRAGIGVAVGIESMTAKQQADGAEPAFDPAGIADLLAQIAVHEGAHILQVRAQGSLENYRSIYNEKTGSMLAIAVREGCAEYLTYLASGERFGTRHLYVAEHEQELWEAFKQVADEAPFSVPGWFSGSSEEHPDWPFQVGYALGFRICETYHQSFLEGSSDVASLFALYDPEQIKNMADTYEASFDSSK